MSNIHENSSPWIEYLESIDKLVHDLVDLVSSSFGEAFNSSYVAVGDGPRQKFVNVFHGFLTFLSFDDFQLQLLKVFLFTFVSTVALIFVAWHIYGPRISEQFMEPNSVTEDFDSSLGEYPTVKEKEELVGIKMTDKIKSFFQKKNLTRKFANAGKGYKLTDSANSAVPARPVEPIQRVEPTEEAKVAGQAALARLDAARNPNKPAFNTSYAAIQAQVKRELEQERKKALEKEKADSEQPKEKGQDKPVDKSSLAVTDVYFRCPYLSNEVLSRDEWRERIREFLYEQLKGEEAGLTACLVIQNCNFGEEKIKGCVETLGKYLENIINNPEAEKYRKIRMRNKILQEKVLPMKGAMEFLNATGFRQEKLTNSDVEEEFLVWHPENCNVETVTMLLEALKSAERIPLELDRNLQILLPTQARDRNELPPSFFSMTPEEIKKEHQLQIEAVETSQMLRTKAMREKEEQQRLRMYKYSLIRVKFPDNIILQGTFSVREKLQSVVDFVQDNLQCGQRPFHLMQLGEKLLTENYFDKTLLELKLCPAVLLAFLWKDSPDSTSRTGFLKEELLAYIQPV